MFANGQATLFTSDSANMFTSDLANTFTSSQANMFTSKLEKLKSMIWPTSILVKQTGEDVELAPEYNTWFKTLKDVNFPLIQK